MVEESEVEEAAKEGTEIKTPDEIPVHDLELTATVGKVRIEILIFNSSTTDWSELLSCQF